MCDTAYETGSETIGRKVCVRERAGKDDSIYPSNLSNRFKTIVVDALRSAFPISLLLDIVGLWSSSLYYQAQSLEELFKVRRVDRKITEIVKGSGFSYGYRRE